MANTNITGGAQITITNISTDKTFNLNENGYIIANKVINEGGSISPSLVPSSNVETVIPAVIIKIPSFVTYKYNSIKP